MPEPEKSINEVRYRSKLGLYFAKVETAQDCYGAPVQKYKTI